jgi:hypothetical protein
MSASNAVSPEEKPCEALVLLGRSGVRGQSFDNFRALNGLVSCIETFTQPERR